MQIMLPEHYKLIIKAFGSKNNRVLATTFRLVRDLGNIEERSAEFVD
jgi:hypothetical protein